MSKATLVIMAAGIGQQIWWGNQAVGGHGTEW